MLQQHYITMCYAPGREEGVADVVEVEGDASIVILSITSSIMITSITTIITTITTITTIVLSDEPGF